MACIGKSVFTYVSRIRRNWLFCDLWRNFCYFIKLFFQDSQLERDLGVARGFTSTLLERDDAIVSEDLLGIFGLIKGDNITITFDILGLLPPSYDEVQAIIFDYIPNANNMPSKGQAFLKYFGEDPNLTIGEMRSIIA